MNFVQYEFLWFFSIVFVLYWSIRDRMLQNALLVLTSAIFYGWVHPWFLLLVYASASLDFIMGLSMKWWPERKKQFLIASMVGNLSMLGVFKYLDFFVVEFGRVLTNVGLAEDGDYTRLGILLPVGISFYTFQTMSYTISVYRGELTPRRNFIDYLVFVSFFPQLVAGPIERATRLLPQIETDRVFSIDNVRSGFALAMWGAFKKIVIADTLAPYVDKVFIHPNPEFPLIWAATMAFSVQILADFSGYTDLARGTARMLGFDLVRNFDRPYMSASTPEFWRRWHMSLSYWIRDYLLVPLLGQGRTIPFSRYLFATTVTFMLLGIWHGPTWNFVLLGFWNGGWMIFYPYAASVVPESVKAMRGSRKLAILFHQAIPGLVGAMMFRETHLSRIVQHLTQNPFTASHEQWVAGTVVFVVTIAAGTPMVLAMFAEDTFLPRLRKTVWWLPAQTGTWACFAVAMYVFFRVTVRDFVYFAF